VSTRIRNTTINCSAAAYKHTKFVHVAELHVVSVNSIIHIYVYIN